MPKSKIKVGTRGSLLALTQTNLVIDRLKELNPDTDFEVIKITTKGDRILDKTLSKIGGKGLFIKEIETALTEREIDIAIHSMKDMPSVMPEGFELGAITMRADVRDALVTKGGVSFEDLPKGAVIGTSSLRRGAQILSLRPDLVIKPIRGNVGTRMSKIETENLDGVILAAAGLDRLDLGNEINYYFNEDDMVPAVGQGALGIEIREGDKEVLEVIGKLAEENTTLCVEAEREFMRMLNGGCHVPIGAIATIDKDELKITAMVATCDGSKVIKASEAGPKENYLELARTVSMAIIDQGGKEILENIEL